ncbi:hypothetical protein PpBr36_07562 [Pyricularia pennisetigena]|uniref:hypothetical protein n=1 Tax=Pyricularia pennisetigena TaxID=1578925 RepID=UPI001151F321|nr:hypothetical protein PpBr36_07562 [Pyricularia pennisetigena]TLS25217.1 hypothetical protein PpBr36_07562 [Pyricularia pennisetigena]
MSSSFINGTYLPGSVHSANTSKKVTQHRSSPYLSIQNSSAMGSSWPPTQLHLREIMTPDYDNDIPILERNLDFIDDDPLTYFLTPTKEEDDPMMDFDAGIDGSSADMIRSVSPSQLDGGKKSSSNATSSSSSSSPFARPPTPPRSPPGLGESTDEEMDDDEDEYIRLGSRSQALLPLSLSDFSKEQALLRTASFPGRSQRGRRVTYTANSSRRRLSPRSWREPSPDVWSIEEEPEDSSALKAAEDKKKAAEGKPKKRVRFVLPAEESFH